MVKSQEEFHRALSDLEIFETQRYSICKLVCFLLTLQISSVFNDSLEAILVIAVNGEV